MKNILITGATGFIGGNLINKLLLSDYNVSIIIRSNSNIEALKNRIPENRIVIFDGNIEHLAKFMIDNKIECVIHLASLFISEHKTEDIVNLLNSNILFGTQLLEAMKLSNVSKIINTGTSWQHYNGSKSYLPACLYAATKEAFEKILEYYVSAENMQAVTLKLCDTYGLLDTRKKLINLLIHTAKTNEALDMSEGQQKIDIVYIDDVIDNFVAAIQLLDSQNEKTHKQYFVTSGEFLRLREIVEIFENIFETKLNINWGKRPYRKRENMEPYIANCKEILVKSKINLNKGLEILYGHK